VRLAASGICAILAMCVSIVNFWGVHAAATNAALSIVLRGIGSWNLHVAAIGVYAAVSAKIVPFNFFRTTVAIRPHLALGSTSFRPTHALHSHPLIME